MQMIRRFAITLFSVATLLAFWAVLAVVFQSRYLPSPSEVAEAWQQELSSGALVFHIRATLLRVAGSFIVAMVVGSAIGIWLGRQSEANRFFDPWLIFVLNIPALVTIVFCYLWIGITEVAAISAVAINKIPNVAITLREGARSIDPNLDDVARGFQLSRWTRFSKVVWPQLEPYMASAVRNGLALIWKIVLLVELLGRSNGVGFQINLFFGMFDLARILAYAISFMALVWLIETVVVKPWERRARAWRGEN